MEPHDVTLITKVSHPTLFAAFELISHDSGRQAGHRNYAVPDHYAPFLATMEAQLAPLRRDADLDFETLCIGEGTESELIVARYELTHIDELLQRFFEEFC